MLGEHEAKITLILERIESMCEDISDIKDYMSERRGERKIATWMLMTGSAVLGSMLAFILNLLTRAVRLS